jgi:hypothetical protein
MLARVVDPFMAGQRDDLYSDSDSNLNASDVDDGDQSSVDVKDDNDLGDLTVGQRVEDTILDEPLGETCCTGPDENRVEIESDFDAERSVARIRKKRRRRSVQN